MGEQAEEDRVFQLLRCNLIERRRPHCEYATGLSFLDLRAGKLERRDNCEEPLQHAVKD